MNKIALGGIWLDDCRIPYQNHVGSLDTNGRFPANLLVSDDILNDGTITKQVARKYKSTGAKASMFNNTDQPEAIGVGDSGSYSRYFDLDKWFENI